MEPYTRICPAGQNASVFQRFAVRLEKTNASAIPENVNKKKVFDRGIEIFYVKPGAEIVLRNDGSFGISLKERESRVLDKRKVEDGEFRIRENKIICNDVFNC